MLVSLALPACTAVYLDLGLGNDRYIEQGSNPRGLFRVSAERAGCYGPVTCFLEFDHHSSIKDGVPFNENPEQVANQWNVGVRIPLWKAGQ